MGRRSLGEGGWVGGQGVRRGRTLRGDGDIDRKAIEILDRRCAWSCETRTG